ncbi:helix-turn-helix domain-containing protein [Okeania sp. SIO3I5]|uniref:helix-turn-helix domain-containing protein n=1 Tax=Okeania sp. SIO3I5 TaxID=2607805 RepID=UPI0025DA61CD|nr:helix-turn-helix domain-containing protein [Okeania sp. SIO3I5]
MLLGFKTELHPTNQQKTLLAKHAGVARHAYNSGLLTLVADKRGVMVITFWGQVLLTVHIRENSLFDLSYCC